MIGEDIPGKLALFLEEKSRVPFQWGANDCCTFTSDWIAMRSGEDPASGVRGTYRTALGAARVLKARNGVDGIARAFCTAKGWAEVHPAFSQRGDVMVYQTEHGPALGICCGHSSAFVYTDGVKYVETLKCSTAWRVKKCQA
jgi:hypothetical protein